MYVFEFSHKFSKDDLSHMWQNLPPRVGTDPEKAMATVSHPLLVNELLADPSEAIDNMMDQIDNPENLPYRTGLPEKLQWMVFKVKQRAKKAHQY